MDRLAAISFKSSYIARYVHAIVFLFTIIALWLCGLLVWLKVVLTAVLLCACVWQHRKQKQFQVSAIGFEQGQWWALIHSHKLTIELVNEQLVLPWLMVLNLREKESGKKYALALWPDTASADDLRRLRVFLRYH